MKDVMKKRVVGAVVLVMIGVLVPLLLVRCLHGGTAGTDSMRVYEINPNGEAQRADSQHPPAGPSGKTGEQDTAAGGQTPAQADVDGATGVPQREDGGGQTQPEAVSPEAKSAKSRQSMQTPPVAGNHPDQSSASNTPPAGGGSVPEQVPHNGSPGSAGPAGQGHKSLRKTASSKGWVVQVASFGDKDNAERLAHELSDDFDAFYRAGEVNGKTYYRVRVGPFDSEDAARSAAAKLRQRGRSTLVRRSE